MSERLCPITGDYCYQTYCRTNKSEEKPICQEFVDLNVKLFKTAMELADIIDDPSISPQLLRNASEISRISAEHMERRLDLPEKSLFTKGADDVSGPPEAFRDD